MRIRAIAFAMVVLGAVMAFDTIADANSPGINIHHGRIWHTPNYTGAAGWDAYIIYPGGVPVARGEGGGSYVLTRQWNDQTRKGGTYCMSTDWKGNDGITYPDAVSYNFRSFDYGYPYWFNGSFNYVFPLGMVRDIRWAARPTVTIRDTLNIDFAGPDGLATPNDVYPSYGNDPRPPFTTDAALVTEMRSEAHYRYIQGVKIKRVIYSYPQGTPHQDYVIHDITLTNDGLMGDQGTLPGTKSRIADTTGIADAPIQTINKLLWMQVTDIQTHAGTGHGGIKNDQDGKYVQPWPGATNSAWFTWDEDDPLTDGPDLGDPGLIDVEHIMVGNAFIMSGPLFVSTGPGAAYDTPLENQPLIRAFNFERAFDLAGKAYSPTTVNEQRDYAADGVLHAALDESYQSNAIYTGIREDGPGVTCALGFGPSGGTLEPGNERLHGWDIPPGEKVRIVLVIAAGGIDQEEGRRIGQYYADQSAASAPAADWMTAADQDLYFTGEDSVRKAMNMAYWNFHGSFASGVTQADKDKWGVSSYVSPKPSGRGAFDVPEAPRPPGSINVRPSATGGVEVIWGREAETASDHDTQVNDFRNYRIYKQSGSRFSAWEIVTEGPASYFTLDPNSTTLSWRDAATVPGTEYWYAVVAVDDGTQNWANPGVALESGRWWTWSGFMPATGVTPGSIPAVGVDDVKASSLALSNSPNPFNPSTTVTYSLDADYDNVSITVYDILGREVTTLVDQPQVAGAHHVRWNGIDNAGREVGSGLYIARLTTPSVSRSIRMLLIR